MRVKTVESEIVGVARSDPPLPNLAPGRTDRNVVGDAAVDEPDDVVALHQLPQGRFHVGIVASHVVVEEPGNRGRESSRIDCVEISCESISAQNYFFDDERWEAEDTRLRRQYSITVALRNPI